MKIIAATKDTYIVEATGDELAACIGHSALWMTEQAYPNLFDDGYQGRKRLRIGAEIMPTVPLAFLEKLREKQRVAANSAQILRELANMIQGVLPETVLAEPELKP